MERGILRGGRRRNPASISSSIVGGQRGTGGPEPWGKDGAERNEDRRRIELGQRRERRPN